MYVYEMVSVLQHKDERRRKDENILKQSHQLVAEVIEHSNFLHSLLVKTAIYGYIVFILLYL
jgi:short subunit fatty acids transporter